MTVALLALVLGLPVVAWVLLPLLRPRREPLSGAQASGREELETEKRLVLQALRELDLDYQAGHLAEADYQALRARDEARASRVLRQLDALPPPPPLPAPPAAAPAAAPWSRQPAVLAGGAVGLLVFGVTLGVLASRFTAPSPPEPGMGPPPPVGAPLPGPAGTPGPGAGEAGPPRPIPPGMLEGMLRAARASLEAGRVQEAIAAYQAVLRREPNNVDALTHFGLILAMAGHADRALEYLDRALAVDPDYPEALSYSAEVRYELKQDYAGAIAAWERFARVVPNPEARERALARIREARARLGAAGTPGPGGGAGTVPAPARGGGTSR